MVLRRAKISDSKFYFILRNQINTRKFSLNKKKIPYAKHQKWFLLNYKKKNNFFFIITHKTKNAGYLRLSKKKNVICYCGSGITACNIIFVLYILNFKKIKLYDGSWAEWGKIK